MVRKGPAPEIRNGRPVKTKVFTAEEMRNWDTRDIEMFDRCIRYHVVRLLGVMWTEWWEVSRDIETNAIVFKYV